MRKLNYIILVMIGFVIMGASSLDKKQKFVSGPMSDTLTWKQLGEIKFVVKPHKDYGDVKFPVVNAKLKTLNKKRIVMSGFIVPIDADNYALSKNVFASCFFCGKAGPETIVGLKFRNLKGRLKTDQYVTLTGTWRVNEGNVDDWIYNLDDVVITKGN